MKIRDDDLAGLNEFDEQPRDSWPDQPDRSEEPQQADQDQTPESLDDKQRDAGRSAFPAAEPASESESADWPSQHLEATESGIEPAPASSEAQAIPAKGSAGQRIPIRLVKIGALAVLLLAALSSGIAFWHHTWQHQQQKVQIIRHPVPHHLYKQQLDFFILASSAQGKALVKLGLVFEFYARNAYQQFQQKNLAEKDLVFEFLQQAHPRANTQDDWRPIVQKNLLAYFRNRLPHNGLESIRITYLDEL